MTVKKVIYFAIASCFLSAPVFAIAPHDNNPAARPAAAATPDAMPVNEVEKAFRELDRNHDGYISKDEISSSKALAQGFESADKNHDGKLDLAEFQSLEADASPDRSLASVPVKPE